MNFTTPIEYVVVLMMENHSFDNMLGWLHPIGELTGDESNAAYDGTVYKVGDYRNPSFRTDPGPAHDFPNVNLQIFSAMLPPADAVPAMSGFVRDYDTIKRSQGQFVMACYSPEQVPVITLLAQTFTACTRWFCSVPGPTGPNRIYANCASSKGYAGPQYKWASLPPEMKTLTSIFGA